MQRHRLRPVYPQHGGVGVLGGQRPGPFQRGRVIDAAGEFFYVVTRCDDKGFFIVDVPRRKKVKFYAFAKDHRVMVRSLKMSGGISQKLGKIAVFKY